MRRQPGEHGARERDGAGEQQKDPGTPRVEGRRFGAAHSEGPIEPSQRLAHRGLAEQHADMLDMRAERRSPARTFADVPVGHPGLGRRRGGREPNRPKRFAFQEAFPVADDDEKIARRIRSHGRREHRNRNRRGDVRMRLGVAYDDIRGHGMAERRDAAVAERPRRVDDAAQARHQDLRGALDALQIAGHRRSDCGHDRESRR